MKVRTSTRVAAAFRTAVVMAAPGEVFMWREDARVSEAAEDKERVLARALLEVVAITLAA
jgi:hypothetical protein